MQETTPTDVSISILALPMDCAACGRSCPRGPAIVLTERREREPLHVIVCTPCARRSDDGEMRNFAARMPEDA